MTWMKPTEEDAKTLKAEWDRYVSPFIKAPGCISKDPVVAAAHLTSGRWLLEMGHHHFSFCSPKHHVKIFRDSTIEECAKIAEDACNNSQDQGVVKDICERIAEIIRKSKE